MSAPRNADRDFDVVLFGATGFTGGLTAEYLARHAPAGLRWAIAGRNETKLKRTREHLATIDPALGSLELLEADSERAVTLGDVARRARVVASTVGPFINYGEPLVAACAEAGTDYCDITGEPEFVDRMYLAHHAIAADSGARLVHCCGFDSIPHDLGARFAVRALTGSRGDGSPDEGTDPGYPITLRGVVRSAGTFSGGTLHSALHAFPRAR
ncbi:MAG: saccharopine dehydrogenase NADP-binding domain-containing protein, partial [Nocardioides sp.]